MKVLGAVAAAGILMIAPASASAAPEVVASVKPVHSLVAAVMEGVGQPSLLVKGAASPHTYSLRPSEAAALAEADAIFWVGEPLETFLDHPLETLGADARIVPLIEAEGVEVLAARGAGEAEEHEAKEEGHEHGEEEAHADGDEGHHHRGGADGHVWLDPRNAVAMLDAIAGTLAEIDPENAQRYRDNAAEEARRLEALQAEIADMLAPVADVPFVVFHDAYLYFERRFGLDMVGAITVSPDRAPGAARLRQIRQTIAEAGAACVFAEPQFEPALVTVVSEGSDARQATLDPLGADLEAGPQLYARLLRGMARNARDCLASR